MELKGEPGDWIRHRLDSRAGRCGEAARCSSNPVRSRPRRPRRSSRDRTRVRPSPAWSLGILGLFLGWLWLILPVLAIIFSGVAMNGTRKAGHPSNGMAIAGLVTGIIGVVFYGLIFLAFLSGTS